MREEERQSQDPYAPPPRHKDKSGALVRVVLLAAMLGVAVWGYTEFSQGPALVAEQPVQQQQIADASSQVTPEPIPSATPEAATPAPAAPVDSAPAPAENVPPPSTTITP